jgi:hypothetical protein
MNIRRLLIVLALAALTVPAAAQDQPVPPLTPAPLDVRTDPVLAVASYYNAIALGDYERAYSYWESPPSGATLADFEAGFADTERVAAYFALPVVPEFGAGNGFAQVPVLLAAEHTDGSRHNFTGCLTVHKVNVPVGNATEPDPNWHLQTAAMLEVADFDFALLDQACDPETNERTGLLMQSSPIDLLASYAEAITVGNYSLAYALWDNPPEPSLETFEQGFADTVSASVIVRDGIMVEGTAGSTYASIPALLVATHTDGGRSYFGGCYVARRSNVPIGMETEPSPDWWFFDAQVAELDLAALQDPFARLDNACDMTEAAG